MARANGSHIEKLVVVPHRPWYLLLSRVVSVLFLVALVLGAFLYGRSDGFQSERANTGQVERLSRLLAASNEELRALRQRAAVLESGSLVDREAAEQVRQTNREMRDEIASLQQEVRLYRGIMAPDETSTGLAIDELLVQSLDDNRYRFVLVMAHANSDGSWLEGSVGINIVGENTAGERVIYPLKDVSSDLDRVDIRLRYRYFQEIEGEMSFPQGFTPQQVRIVAQVTGNRAATRDVELQWDELGEL